MKTLETACATSTAKRCRTPETRLLAFSPKMSYLPKEMTERDPDFWTPKPPATAPAKKSEKKP